jgi:hypothetical protein
MAVPPSHRVLKIADRTGVTASTDDTDGPLTAKLLPSADPGFYECVLQAVETTLGTSTFDAKIQDSLDGSAPWFDWVTFTQIADVGAAGTNERKTAARDPLPWVRVFDGVGAGASTFRYTVHVATRRRP